MATTENVLKEKGLEALITTTKQGIKDATPTKTSQLTNDSTYQTKSEVTSTVATATAGLAKASAIPTKTSQLTNDSTYQTKAEVEATVNTAFGKVVSIKYQKVESLPETGKEGIIYLVAHTHGDKDIFDEYIWIDSSSVFEKIGNTDIDLTEYAKKTDLDNLATKTEVDACLKKSELGEITASDVTAMWNSISV